jgi:chromosome segregation ATPase
MERAVRCICLYPERFPVIPPFHGGSRDTAQPKTVSLRVPPPFRAGTPHEAGRTTAMLMEEQKEVVEDAEHIETQIQALDAKISEIMESVNRLADEEAALLEQRSKRRLGDIDDIIDRSREEQKRLQELRDAIEVEQAPLAELKARREEYVRQYQASRRVKTKTKIREILQKVEAMHGELDALKNALGEMEDMI